MPTRPSIRFKLTLIVCDRSAEEFSYFTLRGRQRQRRRGKEDDETTNSGSGSDSATSLFGISCARQIDADLLAHKSPEVTRSTVQKAVVVVTDSPRGLGQLREKLSMVTSAWFAQRYVYTPFPKRGTTGFGRPLLIILGVCAGILRILIFSR